jgi:hypothetical protein
MNSMLRIASGQVPDPALGPSIDVAPDTAVANDIRNAYAQLVRAVEGGDGKTATSLASKSTLDYYERCRRLAIDSKGVDFADLKQLDVILIFQLRYLLSRERLSGMNGSEVFAWGVESGLVKKEVFKAISLDRVHVDGNIAFASLRKNGQPVKVERFRFAKENGQWKFDFAFLMPAFEKVFDDVRATANKSKTELAVYLLEKTYKQPIPFAILDGPLK